MLRQTFQSIGKSLKTLNLYISTDEDTHEERRDQIIATRIFLVIFIISLVSLIGYASLTLRQTIVHIDYPSESIFEKLQAKYSDTLICPCTQTTVQLDKFVQTNVSYHQICSSMFVSDEWISSISSTKPQLFYSLDARRMLSSQMQSIASQCQSSKDAVKDALTSLASTNLFVPMMISRSSLKSQVGIIVNEARKNALAEQEQSRGLILFLNQQNQLVSALSSNFLYRINNINEMEYVIVQYLKDQTYPPESFSGVASQFCNCLDSSNCTYPSGIYPQLSGYDSYQYLGAMFPPVLSSTQIPGLKVGCMPFDSIMESTLEFFYNQSYLSILFNSTSLQPLNPSVDNHFSVHTKIRQLIEELFIEKWSSREDFTSFFRQCQPDRCTYSYSAIGNLTFIFTMILSLIGGLFIALKIAAIFIVKTYRILMKKLKKIRTPIANNQDSSMPSNQEKFSVQKILQWISAWVLTFNLFKQPYNDAHGRRNEILSTRFYAVLMLLGLVVIVFYNSFAEHRLTFHVQSPSLVEYRQLVAKYPDLLCECKDITTIYSKFLSMKPTFHQACSSIFVSDAYIPHFYEDNFWFPLGRFNIRIAVPSYSASGRTVCDLVKDTSLRAIETFLQTTYISNDLTPEQEFNLRMTASIANFEALAPSTFIHLIELNQYTTQGNQLLAGSFTNTRFQYNQSSSTGENFIDLLWVSQHDRRCTCGLSSNSCAVLYDQYCQDPDKITQGTTCTYSIPGLLISCYIVDALTLSSLACLYDEDCIQTTLWAVMANMNLTDFLPIMSSFILNKNAVSRFPVNFSMFRILAELGIENWNEKLNYSAYYDNCNPSSCSYTIIENFNIPMIVTTVIGLIGGLSVILRILVPLIIKLFRRRSEITGIGTTKTAFKESRFHRWIAILRQLNFFKNAQTESESETHREQIITTRLYIILWIISVSSLSIYTGLSSITFVVLVDSPTLARVNQLQLTHLNELSCPCTKITIPFGTFTVFNFTTHQICSSDLISNAWRAGLFNFSSERTVSRAVLSSHFQLLYLLCLTANKTLLDATANFYANQMINVKLLTPNEFIERTRILIDDFQTKTLNSFRRNLALIVDITLSNQLISAYETNWHIIPNPLHMDSIYTESRSYQSGNCSCGTSRSASCIDPLIISENTSIPGMFIGCLPLTSLRLSTLECFYDQACLENVKEALTLQDIPITALNSTRSSQFSVNITLDHIIDQLMLEDWTKDTNYSNYFAQCNVQQCSYSIVERNNPLVIVTTLLGLYGGLTVTLNFIAPNLVQIARKIYKKCRRSRTIIPQAF